MYPVGSIYISEDVTSPASIYGGEWERVSQGQTLFGVDEGDTKFESSGLTGGSSSATVNGTNFRTQIRFESNGKFFFAQDESSPAWNSTSSVTKLSYDWSTGLWGTKTGARCGGSQTINTVPHISRCLCGNELRNSQLSPRLNERLTLWSHISMQPVLSI